MRKTLLAAAAAFVIGGASIGSLISYAQPAPPPPGPAGQPGAIGPGWMHHPGPWRWMHHWREAHRIIEPGALALVFPHKDRNLSPSDVQTIAQAFLLWRGNHTWKVVNVAPTSDGQIGFALATENGSVIATFTMDPHTGHVTRTS